MYQNKSIQKKKTKSKSLFKSTIAISLIASIGIIVFSGLYYIAASKKEHVDMAENEAKLIADILSYDFLGQIFEKNFNNRWNFRRINDQKLKRIDSFLQETLHEYSVIKIKIFDKNAKIIYSTDQKIIGQIDEGNIKLQKALKGKVYSEWTSKDEVWDLSDEMRFDKEVVETYLPLRNTQGEILGVYEIYLDVTEHYRIFIDALKDFIIPLTIFIMLIFSVICTIVYVAERAIFKHTLLLEEEKENLRLAKNKLELEIIRRQEIEEILRKN